VPHGTGGDRHFVPLIAKAIFASGADVVFFEIHPDPINATCDASNQIAIKIFQRYLLIA
jgi:2-dehydro-3-deoxyphosphooctonate aldolase (KDO 8-P synthase)